VTLWMSGTHRRVATKADSKVLSGLDLQYALDPLEDQSFFFTAARCLVRKRGLDQPVGSSPRRSRLWVGPSRDWADFSAGLRALLGQLASQKRALVNPLPILAEPVLDAEALKAVRNAYDAAIIPPELVDPASASADAIELRERVGRVVLEPFAARGPDFSMRVHRADGLLLGTVDTAFTVAPNGSAQWVVSNDEDKGADRDLFTSIVRALKQHRGWLKVWYDSGHTLADEAFFETRFRDQPFQDYLWTGFAGIDIKKEKPSPLSAATIGAQDSLFCWVKKCWAPPGSSPGRGWLACDDGAMEKADFLHLDLVGGVETLSLIHVKGSGAHEADRRVSVSDYEIVTSQAVKNLRWVDQATLAGGLAGRLRGRIGDKVWHNGKRTTAEEFARRVAALGANHARNVVILQPRVTKSAELAGRNAAADSPERLRLLQLDALLLGARADVQALNARLLVIGDAGS